MEINEFIPVLSKKDYQTGCCPVFHPEEWDGKVFDFSKYQFCRTHTRSFFYIPLNMNGVMKRVKAAIDKAQATAENRYLMLSEDLSLFKCTHDILVNKPVPGYPLVTIEGQWYAKVFDGAYKNLPLWMQILQKEGQDKGLTFKRVTSFYTTCLECAKKYQHNHVVLFGLIQS